MNTSITEDSKGPAIDHTAKRRCRDRTLPALLAMLAAVVVGCAGGGREEERNDFFTSGSRDADQRASQRMVRDQQLEAAGQATGGKEKDGENAPAKQKLTLYERLGGEPGLTAIVNDFLPRALEDPRVNWARKGIKSGGLFRRDESATWNPTSGNVETLKKHLVQFLSLATGGPSDYDGKEMKGTHANMKITNPEFDAVIGDLKAALDKLRIADQEQKELLAIVESTRPQVVTER
jgi:hemoglobin